jgi:hypothetical protein
MVWEPCLVYSFKEATSLESWDLASVGLLWLCLRYLRC